MIRVRVEEIPLDGGEPVELARLHLIPFRCGAGGACDYAVRGRTAEGEGHVLGFDRKKSGVLALVAAALRSIGIKGER